MLLFHFAQASCFKGRVGGLEAPLGVAVDFLRWVAAGGEGERVESVVDAGGVEGGCGRGSSSGGGGGGIELGKIEATGFLRRGLGFGLCAERGIFFGKEGFFFGFFPREILFFLLGFVSGFHTVSGRVRGSKRSSKGKKEREGGKTRQTS